MVGEGRGQGEEQNPSGGVIGSRRNHGESGRRFPRLSRVQSTASQEFSGGEDGMEMTSGSRASDRYQPWPEW
ncbi:hypothetical protein AB3S75_015524 [Citrus x aurantiifolia]